MKASRGQSGFAIVETLLVLVVLAIVGFAGWFVYHSAQAANRNLDSANKVSSDVPKPSQITSFDDCQKAPGSTILQSSPAQCITKAGQKFMATMAASYLTISEWGIRIPLAKADLADSQYTVASDGKQAHITTKTLTQLAAQLGSCHSGIDDVYLGRSIDAGSFTSTWKPQKIGQYYYGPVVVIEPKCVTQGASPNDMATMQSIQTDLQQAVSQVTAAP